MEVISEEEYKKILEDCRPYIYNLKLIIESTGENGPFEEVHDHEAIIVRRNLMTLAKYCDSILEIGFDMGHSVLFMLMANSKCKIQCYDICKHPYTIHCFNYLSKKFPERLTMVKGDSTQTLPKYKGKNVDLLIVDGSHEFRDANLDFFNGRNVLRKGGYIVFNDVYIPHLCQLWNGYIRDGHIIPVSILPSNQHAIGKNNDSSVIIYASGTNPSCLKSIQIYCQIHGYKFTTSKPVGKHVEIPENTHITNFNVSIENVDNIVTRYTNWKLGNFSIQFDPGCQSFIEMFCPYKRNGETEEQFKFRTNLIYNSSKTV